MIKASSTPHEQEVPTIAHIDNGESDDRHRRARDRRYRRRNRRSLRSIDELKLNGPEYDSAEH